MEEREDSQRPEDMPTVSLTHAHAHTRARNEPTKTAQGRRRFSEVQVKM